VKAENCLLGKRNQLYLKILNPTVVKNLKGTANSSLLFKNADQPQLCQNLVKNIFDLPKAVIVREEIT